MADRQARAVAGRRVWCWGVGSRGVGSVRWCCGKVRVAVWRGGGGEPGGR